MFVRVLFPLGLEDSKTSVGSGSDIHIKGRLMLEGHVCCRHGRLPSLDPALKHHDDDCVIANMDFAVVLSVTCRQYNVEKVDRHGRRRGGARGA